MIVHVYTIAHNEALLMPYFLRHYATYASQIVVLDDASDDGTRDIVTACPSAELRDYPGPSQLDDGQFVRIYQRAYRASRGRADWVMCVDVDELVYHQDIVSALADARVAGYRLLQPIGYNMIGTAPPTTSGQIYDEIAEGVLADRGRHKFSKPIVFDPAIELYWRTGRHAARSSGRLPRPHCGLLLLHFRYLSRAYAADRTRRNICRAYPRPEQQTERAMAMEYEQRRVLTYYDWAITARTRVIDTSLLVESTV